MSAIACNCFLPSAYQTSNSCRRYRKKALVLKLNCLQCREHGRWQMEDGRKHSQAIAGTLRLYGNQALIECICSRFMQFSQRLFSQNIYSLLDQKRERQVNGRKRKQKNCVIYMKNSSQLMVRKILFFILLYLILHFMPPCSSAFCNFRIS